MYYIYMLRCADNSLYTGITTDIQRRLKEHFEKGPKCAKYTFTHTAIRLDASQLEYRIKTLKKNQKESLAANTATLAELFGDKLESGIYIKAETEIKNV